jgi:phospholipid/cholesterol/gamma-HCH transport system substrate-binding protein
MTTNLSQNIRVGLFFVFGLVLLWIVYENFDARSSDTVRGYGVKAPFSNLLQLKASDEVRLAGVKIGVVDGTRLENNRAVADLIIFNGVTIPEDSVASISTAGMLGNNYVAITPGGSASHLSEGRIIQTREAMDLNAVIAKVGDLATHFERFAASFNGSGDQESSLFYNLNLLIKENRENLKITLSNFAQFSEKLNNNNSTLGRLMTDDSLYNHAQHVLNKVDNATNSMSDNGPIAAVGAAAGALF